MNSKELNQRLKENKLDNIYLFFGDEDYIKDVYIKRIKDIVLKNDIMGLNYIQYDELPDTQSLADSIESAPMMSDYKIVMLNSLNLMSNSVKKALKDSIVELLEDLPPYTIVVIRESATSGRLKTSPVYKIADKKGAAIDCSLLDNSEMLLFINREIGKREKKIAKQDLAYLISLCNGTISSVMSEVDKITSYIGENEIIKRTDIDLLVKKTIEDKVFDLFDLIIQRNKKAAFNALNDLKLLKNQHSAGQIFSIICENFMNMYVALNNSREGLQQNITAELLELPPNRTFIVKKLLRQCSGSVELSRLERIIYRLSEMDSQIKTGFIDPYYAIEEIIAVF